LDKEVIWKPIPLPPSLIKGRGNEGKRGGKALSKDFSLFGGERVEGELKRGEASLT